MKKQTLQDIAVQKSLTLSEQEAMKVLIFMAGMEAERIIDSKSVGTEQPPQPPKNRPA